MRALSLGSDGEAALPGAGPTLGAGSGATDDQWGRRPAAPRAPLVAPLEINGDVLLNVKEPTYA